MLGTIEDQSPMKCLQGRKQSQSRHSLLASPGGGLALKYERLSVDGFEGMVSLTFLHKAPPPRNIHFVHAMTYREEQVLIVS